MNDFVSNRNKRIQTDAVPLDLTKAIDKVLTTLLPLEEVLKL